MRGNTKTKPGQEDVNLQDTSILDFNQLLDERENDILESRQYNDRHENVNLQDTSILDFNQLLDERENDILESRQYNDREQLTDIF